MWILLIISIFYFALYVHLPSLCSILRQWIVSSFQSRVSTDASQKTLLNFLQVGNAYLTLQGWSFPAEYASFWNLLIKITH
jgi:hypothetical protein